MSQDAQRLMSIIADSDDAIIANDLDGVVTDWNPAAEKLFGYLAEEMIGENINRLAPEERPDEMPTILARIRRGAKVDHFLTQRRHKSGKLVDVSLTVSPITDGEGNVVGASKIARDITDRVRDRVRTQKVQEANNRLLREMNHRVGNNLAIIVAMLRQSKKTMNAESKAAVDAVIDEIFVLASEQEERLLRDNSHLLDEG